MNYFCTGMFFYSLPFIQSLMILARTHRYLFCTLGYSPVLLCLFSCSNYSSFGHWEFFQSVPLFLWYIPIIVEACICFCSFLALSNILTLQDGPCVFASQVLETAISPRSLLLENGTRNTDLGTRCASCYWDVIATRPSQLSAGNICMYGYICVCVYIYTHACTHVHLYICILTLCACIHLYGYIYTFL